MPRLSVILPARNAESTVGTAVRSTLRALPRDAELVVLDDGSADNTAEQALAAGTRRGVQDPRLRVEREDTPGGIATALNWLLEHSDSALVARMDADDVCMPWRFAPSIGGLERLGVGGTADTDVLFSQVINFSSRRWVPQAPLAIPPAVFGFYLLLTNPAAHPAMVATRQILDEVGGYREVPAEDYDLWIRVARHGGRLRRLSQWGVGYRVHGEQITASAQWREASWRNERQAVEFSRLATKLTRQPLERIVSMALDEPVVRQRKLQIFETVFLAALDRAHMNAVHRSILERKLRGRLNWAGNYTGVQA